MNSRHQSEPESATPDSPSSIPGKTERPSLAELFEREETGLLRYAYGLTGRRAIAEEIVQDVFLQLHRHWEEVEQPRAWLYRSIRNRSYNHLRDHRREVSPSEASGPPSSPEPVSEVTPPQELQRLETAGHLQLLLSELDPPDQELIHLKYVEDLKYREIAERTGLSIGNVGYRLHHLLKLLAGKLHTLGIDSPAD
ncbi:MAG: RNA polymerase sigma factor [Verrucomicrobiota bacterium]